MSKRSMSQWSVLAVVLAVAVLGGTILGITMAGNRAGPTGSAVADSSPDPYASPTPSPTPTPTPSPTPSPTPEPTPTLVPAPLTGRMVEPDVAGRKVIAVMIDDHPDARPQSGFSSAAVVWHAPAEGGVPRYMLWFQDRVPESVGPVRSARYYFIGWAAEWNAVYGHVGGSPQALKTLREDGNGELVYNADEFRWGGTYFWRTKDRFAPHNVYTDGKSLRRMANKIKAVDGPAPKPAWTFRAPTPVQDRPAGTTIRVVYTYNTVTYEYDRVSNTYPRSVSGEGEQYDRGTGQRVAPRNVVVILMRFGPLGNSPNHGRQEADFIGSGTVWVSSNGVTVKGTWRKDSLTKPTRFFDSNDKPIALAPGQTFIQVLPIGSEVTFMKGKPVPAIDQHGPEVR